jgi:hypothetical protein
MLRNIFLLLICLLLIGGCIFQACYLKSASQSLRTLLSQAKQYYDAHASTQALDICNRLYTEWERRSPLLASLLPHQQLDDIYLELLHLQSLLQGGDAIEILYSFQQLDYLFSHLTKADALSFGNIF